MIAEPRLFDLNIEKILEAWTSAHAVRELIANALDEQILSDSAEVDIFKRNDGAWVVQDFGRGLRHEHFTQNESAEKLDNVGRVIGKFGVGLKDALATLHRNGVTVMIESPHGSISVLEKAKHGFEDVVTLHAAVSAPARADGVGTTIALIGLADAHMEEAKRFFLKFSGEHVLEKTGLGEILARKDGDSARVYVAGLMIAEEDRFAFSYNITSLNAAMSKALNRERTNVGRTAYTPRVKDMLLQAKSAEVAAILASEIAKIQSGNGADEVNWKDVAVHASKILNASGSYLFITAQEGMTSASAVDHARNDGLEVIVIPDNIRAEVAGALDTTGAPIRDLSAYQDEWNDSFEFEFVEADALTASERSIFDLRNSIASIAGGFPPHVKGVRVSETMRADFLAEADAVGLWDPETKCIVIRRDQLGDLKSFAGTLLHEVVHAATGYDDVTRDFESALTEVMGAAAAQACANSQHMDLSGLKPAERDVEITHPGTGNPLGIRVTIVSLDDDRMRKLRRAITDDALKLQQRNKAFKAEELESYVQKILWEAARGWEWYNPTGSEGDDKYDLAAMPNFNGEVPEFNQRNFMAIIKELPWFSTQLNEAVSESEE